MQIPYFLQPILNYKAIEFEDPKRMFGQVRTDLCSALIQIPPDKFQEFCQHIINLQHFRYKLNNTFGAESLKRFTEEERKLFSRQIFNPLAPIKPLPTDKKDDPGVIVQGSLNTDNPAVHLSGELSNMPIEQFQRFFTRIWALVYFADLESGCYFTKHTELFDEDNPWLWYIDEDFLSDRNDLPHIL